MPALWASPLLEHFEFQAEGILHDQVAAAQDGAALTQGGGHIGRTGTVRHVEGVDTLT